MQIIEMAVKDLKPYEKNPRLNDDHLLMASTRKMQYNT